jgi:hypothetical protein
MMNRIDIGLEEFDLNLLMNRLNGEDLNILIADWI